MFDEHWFSWLVASVPGLPALAFLVLGAALLFFRAPSERATRVLVLGSLTLSLLCAMAIGVILMADGSAASVPRDVHLGSWFTAGKHHFELSFHVDGLTVTMMLLVTGITALIGRFSVHYLHNQPGFARFFLLLALFSAGMLFLVLGASVDQLFVGWELVGLSSALLVGYFRTRGTPMAASLRVFITYRLCDLGLLVGAVLLHKAAGTAFLEQAFDALGTSAPTHGLVVVILPLCFLLAAMGKSAQFPFGSWLPRAMEGPTPSSALFYGAISVHAGVYLLLRTAPLFEHSLVATVALIWVGASTALHAAVVSRVQTDAKSALAYATMTQVGLMFVEIGLGLTTLAMVHLAAHALLRTHQLLRAPSALRDAEQLRAAGVIARREAAVGRLLPQKTLLWLYRTALERFHLETLHERLLVTPVMALGQALERMEQRWVGYVTEVGRRDEEEEPAMAIPTGNSAADSTPRIQ